MKIEYNNNYTIIDFEEKRLDAFFASNFRKNNLDKITEIKNDIILDLHQVDFIDSSGLGAIVSVLQSLDSKKNLMLCGAGKSIEERIMRTHLDNIFSPLYKDVYTVTNLLH